MTPASGDRSDKIKVVIVAASMKYVGGQSVQAVLLRRYWQDDLDVELSFLPIDPELPRWLRWAERVPVFRTIIRQPFYLLSLWRQLKDAHIAHIFSASYWSFLVAPAPALWIAHRRGKNPGPPNEKQDRPLLFQE